MSQKTQTLFSNCQLKSLWGMNKGMEITPASGGKMKVKKYSTYQGIWREANMTQWTIWTDQQLLDYNLEIHGISSTNSVLISYTFFKYHFKNSCHKHRTFNGSLLLSKLSSGPNMYFQPYTAHIIFCVRDPTQTGWATLPLNTSHIATSLLLPRTFFFLEYLSLTEKSI